MDALPTSSRPLHLPLWWRGVRPAAEDWTAFFHLTPPSNDRELRGQIDQAITDNTYPPTVWSAGEVVEDHVQISVANLQAGRYAVWMGLYSPECRSALPWKRALVRFLRIGPGRWNFRLVLDYEQGCWCAGDKREQ